MICQGGGNGGGMMEVACGNCGKLMLKSSSAVGRAKRRNGRMFCGPECLSLGRSAITSAWHADGGTPQFHRKFVDLSGQRFGRLLVLDRAPPIAGRIAWRCKCDCGKEHVTACLRDGAKSCGCLAREKAKAAGDRTRTHGLSGTSTYNIWTGMLQRCHNPKDKSYPRYGGAGIVVCERWHTFENFLTDMGERPANKSIDRFPNGNGGYEPGNCRWATSAEQARNSRNARMVTIADRTQCLTDWQREIGISSTSFRSRLARGWSEERALTTPPDQRFNWYASSRIGA